MRVIELSDKKLANLLAEFGEIVKKISALEDEKQAIVKEQTKLVYNRQRLLDKMKPIVDKLTPSFNLGEFEVITQTRLNKYSRAEVEITDQLEAYKEFLRDKNANNKQ